MNNKFKIVLFYEWKFLVRNRFYKWALLSLLIVGFYAIYYGKAEIDQQRETIEVLMEMEQNEFSQYRNSFSPEEESLETERTHDIASLPSFAWFRHGYHAILPPDDYAALAIGQRDLFRYYYRLTGMSLHYQLFEHELANPMSLLAGNFDLSFVFVFLFPLLIIGICYPIYASDKENGTLQLLLLQAIPIHKIVLLKFLFYFLLLSITGIILLISASLYIQGDFNTFLIWFLVITVYQLFWFSVMFLIVSFCKGTAFNALAGATFWLLLVTIIPSMLNIIIELKFPLNNTELAGLTRRTSLENENDPEEAKSVINEYLAYHPELQSSQNSIEIDLMAKAYAAFTGLKDINNQKIVDDYFDKINHRTTTASNLKWLSPPATMMNIFTTSSQTDLNTFQRFQEDIVAFHRNITSFYFSRLFQGKQIVITDYEQLPVFKLSNNADTLSSIFLNSGKIAIPGFLLFIIGFFKLKQETT